MLLHASGRSRRQRFDVRLLQVAAPVIFGGRGGRGRRGKLRAKVCNACRWHARYRFTRTKIRQSRLGSSARKLSELFDYGKTAVSIGSKSTCKGDDWPLLLIPQHLSQYCSCGIGCSAHRGMRRNIGAACISLARKCLGMRDEQANGATGRGKRGKRHAKSQFAVDLLTSASSD